MALFESGQVYATRGAIEKFGYSAIAGCVYRHINGDYGDTCDDDVQANADALQYGDRIMSVYRLDAGTLWIITEADRSSTTALLPDEY